MQIRTRWAAVAAAVALAVAGTATAAESSASLHHITGDGEAEAVGTITFSDSEYGLLVAPDLHDLQSQGPHGIHVHENPDCGAKQMNGHAMAGAAAGGHYDPEKTGRHAGPYGAGHLGDMPNLMVEDGGNANIPVLAPRLTVDDLQGRAVMLHAEADRYDAQGDHHHGKGGVRMYCGVIE